MLTQSTSGFVCALCFDNSYCSEVAMRVIEQCALCWLGKVMVLTGTVAELKAQVRASEVVDGDRKLEEFRPAGTVVVVENKTAVVHNSRFTTTLDDTVL